jgi:hypothetical protein
MLPFFYTSVLGFRLLPLFISVSFLLYFVHLAFYGSLRWKVSAFPSFALLILSLSLTVVSQDFDIFFSLTIFLCIFHISANLPEDSLRSAVNLYLASATVTSFILILQFVLFFVYGSEFARVKLYGGDRIAFSALWMDFSHLSIFLCSALPFVREGMSNRFFQAVVVVIILVGAFITSARTGFFSLAIVFFVYFSVSALLALRRGRISKALLIYVFSFLTFSVLLFPLIASSGSRFLSLDSTGRFIGYHKAIEFFADQPLFGSYLSVIKYQEYYPVIPHNMFIYTMVVGGLVLTLFYLLWLFWVLLSVNKASLNFILPLFVCSAGLQAVPSVFSAYYFAILLGLAAVSSKKRRLFNS